MRWVDQAQPWKGKKFAAERKANLGMGHMTLKVGDPDPDTDIFSFFLFKLLDFLDFGLRLLGKSILYGCERPCLYFNSMPW